jgi:hypothetical protein
VCDPVQPRRAVVDNLSLHESNEETQERLLNSILRQA